MPDANTTGEYFHAKYVPDRREKPSDKDEREGNLGQAIFHRPASSGLYAMVCHFDIARISYNDITQNYVVETDMRVRRYRALLESVLYTFLEPGGAMRNTQLPHATELNGAVAVSYAPVPAPTFSPLNANYLNDLHGVAQSLNGLHGEGAIGVYEFGNMTALSGILRELIETTTPYELNIPQAN